MRSCCLYVGTIVTATLLAGCVERRVVYVHDQAPVPVSPPPAEATTPPPTPPPGEMPPAPQVEVVPATPGPDYVWMPGVWVWRGGWVWTTGHWGRGPHPHAIWVQGHWERRGRRSYWVGGYWR